MIIVTGTKRSGTSMWMQILGAAGFERIGDPFPRNWGATIRDANPRGFYESKLCRGIYYDTNPDPVTGAYLFPEQVRSLAVKVFIPGVIRTERGFIDRCIATIRPWPEYAASLRELQGHSADADDLDDCRKTCSQLAPELQWWSEYFSLIRDVATRRYPIHFQAYEHLLLDPHRVLTEVFEWLGGGDVERGCVAVDSSLHRHDVRDLAPVCPDLPPGCADAFELLYDTIARSRGVTPTVLARLNETQARLEPFYLEHQAVMTNHLAQRISQEHRA